MQQHTTETPMVVGRPDRHFDGQMPERQKHHIAIGGEVLCGRLQDALDSGDLMTVETHYPIGKSHHNICGNCARSYFSSHGSRDQEYELMGALDKGDWVAVETASHGRLTARVKYDGDPYDYPSRYLRVVTSGEPVERWAYGVEETIRFRKREGEPIETLDPEDMTVESIEAIEPPADSVDLITDRILDDLSAMVSDLDTGEYGGAKASAPEPDLFAVSIEGEDGIETVVERVEDSAYRLEEITRASDREHSSYSSVGVRVTDDANFNVEALTG